MHASNRARFEQSVRDITDQIKLAGREEPRADIFKLLQNWLRDEKKGRWLVIFDNADDLSFLQSAASHEETGGGQAGALYMFPV
jgi:hypothetical protein